MRLTSLLALASLTLACSASGSDDTAGGACNPDASSGETATGEDGGLSGDVSVDVGDSNVNCEPPDLLVLLDRTMTMHFQPDGTEIAAAENNPTGRQTTKFAIAIAALKGLFSTYDTQVRFGLELWPRERDGCLLTRERIEMSYGAPQPRPYNAACEAGEIKAPPGLGNAAGTNALLDVETVPICQTTPLGAALDTAEKYLATIKNMKRAQYLALLTDGADYDLSCAPPMYTDPIAKLHALAEAGLKTYVIGFGAMASSSGVDPVKMNKLACAAQTAKDLTTNCKKSFTTGIYEPVDATATGPRLYIEATNKADLDKELGAIAAALGCRTCLK
jgi:hypothetical protein